MRSRPLGPLPVLRACDLALSGLSLCSEHAIASRPRPARVPPASRPCPAVAVAVTNISRAAVELLHVKTAPDYPIRKAVRASMSLPVALHPCLDRNIHSVVSAGVHELNEEAALRGIKLHSAADRGSVSKAPLEERSTGAGAADDESEPMEYYVDGGVLNNYPIDSFDGWWLSMDGADKFFRKVIGENGHKNYVERFGSYDDAAGVREVNKRTMGFRLSSAFEPDAMHSRLGNDALELKVRGAAAAALPDTPLANKYAAHRYDLTNEAKARYKLDQDLRHTMTWLKSVRDDEKKAERLIEQGQQPSSPPARLGDQLAAASPPPELFSALGVGSVDEVVAQLRQMHGLRPRRGGERLATSTRSASGKVGATAGSVPTGADLQQVLKHDAPARAKIEAVHAAEDLDDARKLDLIQKVVIASLQQQVDVTEGGTLPTLLEACDELEELLEMRAEEIMKRLCGMKPKDIGSVGAFIDRYSQEANDDRTRDLLPSPCRPTARWLALKVLYLASPRSCALQSH